MICTARSFMHKGLSGAKSRFGMRFRDLACIVFFSLNTGAGIFAGGSSYSGGGFGLVVPSMNGRSIGMGRVAVAMPSYQAANTYNPAALYGINVFRLDAGLFYEGVIENTSQGSSFSKNLNVSHVSFAVPLGKKTAVSFGFSRLLKVDYEYQIYGRSFDGYNYDERFKGAGGLQEFSLTAAYRVHSSWIAGFSARYAFGKIRKEWEINWESTDFINTLDKREENLHGLRWSFGLIHEKQQFNAGLYFAVSNGFRKDYLQRDISGDTSVNYSREMNFPFEAGLGGIYNLPGYLIGMDVIYYGWKDVKVGGRNQNFRNTIRLSMGAEKKPSSSLSAGFSEKISYRAGWYVQSLYAQNASRNYSTEVFLTAGVGLPFNRQMHILDIGLELGTRGTVSSNRIRDTIIRMTMTISSGEKWFQQRRKKQ